MKKVRVIYMRKKMEILVFKIRMTGHKITAAVLIASNEKLRNKSSGDHLKKRKKYTY